MKKIKKYVKQIEEEIDGAKNYAECYLSFKAKNEMSWANKYKEVSNDELRHAMTVHDRAVEEIEELSRVFTPPQTMVDEWEKCHNHFIEDVAWIKTMLAM